MEAKEVRIGNIVYDDYTKENKIVYSIEENSIWVGPIGSNEWNQRCPLESIHGIKLQPALLKGLGFNDETGGWYGAQGSEQHWKLGIIEFQTLGDNKYHLCNMMQVKFEYVHQLQNLYFALTGSELTISL